MNNIIKMIIELNIDKLKKEKITPDEAVFLYILSINSDIIYPLKIDVHSLEERGWIKINKNKNGTLSSILLNNKTFNFFSKKEINCESWIEEWRNLFPSGVKSGGYSVRGDKQGILKKMKDFMKNNPKFTKEIIFKATENYINTKKKDGYNYMKLAHYFIQKDGVSELASLCEELMDNKIIIDKNIDNKTQKGKDKWE